ncbi:MAG: outer membrane beta-barrel protein [Burkholderiales bacterium]
MIAALIALGVASTPALSQSQDAGWIFGAAGGSSKFKDGCPGVLAPGSTCDDKDVAWKVFAGYQFNNYFGFEFGYADLGEVTQSTAGTTATFEATGIEMVLVATIPIDQQFSLFAKWGLFSWELDRTIVGAGAGTTESSGKEITYGFGVKYNFTRNIALRLEWQRYMDVGDVSTTGISHVDVGLFGIAFKF